MTIGPKVHVVPNESHSHSSSLMGGGGGGTSQTSQNSGCTSDLEYP